MADPQDGMTEEMKAYGKLVARAWSDAAFKERLMSDTAAVFKENGIHVAPGVEVRVLENSSSTVHLVLPPSPDEELSDEHLEQVAGGNTLGSAGSIGSLGCICGTAGTFGSAGTAGSHKP